MGNKVDLERSRQVVSVEGKELARSYDAKFIETSAGLKHNVDELLVGVLFNIQYRNKVLLICNLSIYALFYIYNRCGAIFKEVCAVSHYK